MQLLSSLTSITSPISTSRLFILFKYTTINLFLGLLSLSLGIFLITSNRRALRFCITVLGFLTAGSLGLALTSAPHKAFISWPVTAAFGVVGGLLGYFLWRVVLYVLAWFTGSTLASYLLTTPLGHKAESYISASLFKTLITNTFLSAAVFYSDLAVTLTALVSGSVLVMVGIRLVVMVMLVQGYLGSVDPAYFDLVSLDMATVARTAGATGVVQVTMRTFRRIRYGPRT